MRMRASSPFYMGWCRRNCRVEQRKMAYSTLFAENLSSDSEKIAHSTLFPLFMSSEPEISSQSTV